MKIAIIGTGKTGGRLLDLLDEDEIVGPFNTANPPTVEKLIPADAAIIFVPGTAVDTILDAVFEAQLSAIWGSTGYEWHPEELDRRLKKANLKWLHATNFSLGMQIVRRCLQDISHGLRVLDDPQLAIHEIHHSSKQDAPSGTALSWQDWLGQTVDITSERKGDIKGIHRLLLKTDVESITLTHEAHDRGLFAKGALWALRALQDESLGAGFYTMDMLFDQKMT